MGARAEILDVGVGFPVWSYSQQEVADRIGITDPRAKRFFSHDHIRNRHLYLPPSADIQATAQRETMGQLLKRFVSGAEEMAGAAIFDCLSEKGISIQEIDYICCVTSTGFIVPTLSAHVMKKLKFREDCQRADIVGMGCNAGLNGLNTISNWCAANPGKYGLLICVEVCSAIYAVDNTPRTAVVNSLFGDGAAVALMRNSTTEQKKLDPVVLDFESHLIPEHIGELRFDWDEEKGRFSFYVGRNTPSAIAAVADKPLARLLNRNGLEKDQIKHWVLHGGGSSVLLGIQDKFRLSHHDLRHTRSVLNDFGNVSSGSFLFSFKRLMEEKEHAPGDLGVLMTMGPGLTIEMALVRW